jgi:hypothetical protein
MLMINALASNDPSIGGDGSPLASSPTECLTEVRFQGILVSLCLTFHIGLHGVSIFDEEVPTPCGTVKRYGQAWWYAPMVAKASMYVSSRIYFLTSCGLLLEGL